MQSTKTIEKEPFHDPLPHTPEQQNESPRQLPLLDVAVDPAHGTLRLSGPDIHSVINGGTLCDENSCKTLCYLVGLMSYQRQRLEQSLIVSPRCKIQLLFSSTL